MLARFMDLVEENKKRDQERAMAKLERRKLTRIVAAAGVTACLILSARDQIKGTS